MVSGYNIEWPDVRTVDECISRCAAREDCWSFDYSTSRTECALQNVSWMVEGFPVSRYNWHNLWDHYFICETSKYLVTGTLLL